MQDFEISFYHSFSVDLCFLFETMIFDTQEVMWVLAFPYYDGFMYILPIKVYEKNSR